MLSRRTAIGLIGAASAAPGSVRAAADPFPERMRLATEALSKEGRYLPLLKVARTWEEPGFQDVRRQWFAFVGDEASAFARKGGADGVAPDLAGAQAEDAVQAIVRASKGRRVVMLNEAHTASRHRAFLGRLARALRKEGFTHLAAETFTNDAPEAEMVVSLRAGQPLPAGIGFYTFDPVFAEAVREALELGYQLVPYEQRQDQASASREPKLRIPVREQAQAENLAAAMRRWPEARFLVHVGLGHLDENPDSPNGPWFAARFKQLTGVDPLTVLQSHGGSVGPHGLDHAVAKAVLARFSPRAPIVVTPAPRVSSIQADLAVFHPSLPDVEGRPGWLAADPKRRKIRIVLAAPARDLALIQAVREGEPDPALPSDQYVLAPGARTATLFLRAGRYKVRIETEGGFEVIRHVIA
jgi:hypothetical protein